MPHPNVDPHFECPVLLHVLYSIVYQCVGASHIIAVICISPTLCVDSVHTVDLMSYNKI